MEKSLYNKNRKYFVQLLIEFRQKAGLLQTDLAEKLKVPQSFISKIETGERKVDIIELYEICKHLKTNLVEFSRILERRIKSTK